MKKILFIVMILLGISQAYSQSAKVVVDSKGNEVGRYVKTSGNNYVVCTQDDFEVPISGHKIVTYSAEKGQGYVILFQGSVNIRSTPSTSGKIIGKMPEFDCVECLGKVNGWYKVKVTGKIGYVRADLVEWDPICTI